MSTCLRRQVGAVIVSPDHRLISTGYNGAPSGLVHCDALGSCLREKMGIKSGTHHELCRGVHAEQNAIIQAAKQGSCVSGCTIYVTHTPCSICAKMIINAGIRKVIALNSYPDPEALAYLMDAGVVYQNINGE